jgi:hypothetical protein
LFLRFVVSDIDKDSERESGVFQAIHKLDTEGRLQDSERESYTELAAWFDANLKKPARFTASKPPFYRKRNRAISWFKDTAGEHVARAWQMAAMLERHGVPVRLKKAARVGYVVYEDEFQVVAEPFANTRA